MEKAQLLGGIAVDGKLVLTTTNGQLVLVQAVSPKMKVLSQAVIAGLEACLSCPAFSKGQLFVRDCTGAIWCFDLK